MEKPAQVRETLIEHRLNQFSGRKCLCVVIPAFNEARTINEILYRVLAQSNVFEVIVVDDASTDGTRDLLCAWAHRDERIRILEHSVNRGKGAAIRTGLRAATADVVIIQDADLEYNPADYASMLEPILRGQADVVYGSRFSGKNNRPNSLWHTLGNRCLTWCSNLASGLRLTDEATCYKMFRREIFDRIELVEDGFGFCPEVTAKISTLGVRIREIPISYSGRTKAEGKKIRLRDGFNALRCIVRYNLVLRRIRGRAMLSRFKWDCLFAIQALLYAFGLLFVTGVIPAWGEWYSESMPFRLQTNALLKGDFALSHNPAELDDDLCWSQGGVHQVWGLGIPLWRLPFEALARIVHKSAFPDRVALGLFITLVAYIVFRTWFLPLLKPDTATASKNEQGTRWRDAIVAIGAVELSLFFAPVANLLSSRMFVYEEVMAYVYFYGVALACGIVSLARKPVWPRFFALCIFAGLGGLVRPTLLFYGVATLMTCGTIMLLTASKQRVKAIWRILVGIFLFASGGGMLFLTNLARFGNGFEFGHRLNLQSGNLMPSVYSTRFNYPFANESVMSSSRELFGAIFQVKELNGFNYYQQAFFPGQSSTFRWREFIFTTYDLSYAVCLAAACSVGIWTLGRWVKLRKADNAKACGFSNGPLAPQVLLIMWGAIAFVITALFFAKTPAIASRYMFDFAACFVAMLTGLWWWLADSICRHTRSFKYALAALCAMLVAWQAIEMNSAKNAGGTPASTTYQGLEFRHKQDGQLPQSKSLPSEYKIGDSMESWGIPFNGEGWDSETGNTKAAVELFVEDPQGLTLEVASAVSTNVMAHDYDSIQAKIGLEFLEREKITSMINGMRIEFRRPKNTVYQKGIQPAFLAMTKPANLGTNDSPFRLLRIAWRSKPSALTPQ